MNVLRVIPTIACTDLDQATEFYGDLGFQREWIWPDEYPSHASFATNDVGFMIVIQPADSVIQKADLYFIVSEIEGYHQSLVYRGIAVSDLIETNYGMKDFSVNDPWGHHFVFGQAVAP